MKIIIIALILSILLAGCTESGQNKADTYTYLCKEQGLNYTQPVIVPSCVYECTNITTGQIFTFLREKCR